MRQDIQEDQLLIRKPIVYTKHHLDYSLPSPNEFCSNVNKMAN